MLNLLQPCNTRESSPTAVRKLDPRGNKVVVVPNLGSLKRTARGFHLSVLTHSYACLGLRGVLHSQGFNVTFNEKAQRMGVDKYTGAFAEADKHSDAESVKIKAQYTLNLGSQTVESQRESVPLFLFSPDAQYGRDLSR